MVSYMKSWPVTFGAIEYLRGSHQSAKDTIELLLVIMPGAGSTEARSYPVVDVEQQGSVHSIQHLTSNSLTY